MNQLIAQHDEARIAAGPAANENCCHICSHQGLHFMGTTFTRPDPADNKQLLERRIFKCRLCGSLIIDPVPTRSQLEHYYQQYALVFDQHHQACVWNRRRVLPFVQKIAETMPAGKILDIGCADGSLLGLLPDKHRKYGLDISAAACSQASAHCDQTINAPFEQAEFSTRFDLIIALDLLEHVVDPVRVLNKIGDCLAPDGQLIIETGNASSLGARVLQTDWYYTSIFGHIAVLSSRTVSELTGQAGIEQLELSLGRHHYPGPLKLLQRQFLLASFHLFRVLYRPFRSSVGAFPALEKYFRYQPPGAVLKDHLIYIGRKRG